MNAAGALLLSFLRDGWSAAVWFLFLAGLLGMLYTTLRAAGSALAGSRYGMSAALKSAAMTGFLLLFTFLGLPEIIEGVQQVLEAQAICDPLQEMGAAAAALVGGLAGIRMLISMVRGLAGAVVSGASTAHSIIDSSEALVGALAVILAGPIAAFFLGACS